MYTEEDAKRLLGKKYVPPPPSRMRQIIDEALEPREFGKQLAQKHINMINKAIQEVLNPPSDTPEAVPDRVSAKDGKSATVPKGYSFVLPYPPTANNAKYVGTDGRLHKSKEARAYTKEVQELAAWWCHSGPLHGPLSVSMIAYRPRRRGDLFNLEKVCMDALKGYAFIDDDQIVEGHQYRRDDPGNPRLEITIEEVTG